MLDPFLLRHIDKIKKECTINEVKRLYAFGSIVDGRFVEGKSDIDFLIEFGHNISEKEQAEHLLKMWISLQNILGCKVDLVSKTTVNGEFFKKYLQIYKELIFEK